MGEDVERGEVGGARRANGAGRARGEGDCAPGSAAGSESVAPREGGVRLLLGLFFLLFGCWLIDMGGTFGRRPYFMEGHEND